jgi:MFS family permease
VSGRLSDRHGARLLSTGGLLLVAATFLGLLLLPVDFPYWAFAALVALNGIGSGLFSAPNTSAVMSSVPAGQRGVASGMRATAMNAGTVLSIGVFFSLLIAGLARSLPSTLLSGLQAAGVPADAAQRAAGLPPVGSVFAAFLGVNPVQQLLGPDVLGRLPADKAAQLTGRGFFPGLISGPFHSGLVVVFGAAIVMSVVAAVVSLARGKRYVHADGMPPAPAPAAAATAR